MVEIIRLEKEEPQETNELVRHTPELVTEAFDLLAQPDNPVTHLMRQGTNLDMRTDALFQELKPESDTDRKGWVGVLAAGILGHAIELRIDLYEKNSIRFLKNQLRADYKRWRETWKKRTVEGSLGRSYATFQNYKDKWQNAGEKFPWLKVAGDAIVNLVRLDHPEYLIK